MIIFFIVVVLYMIMGAAMCLVVRSFAEEFCSISETEKKPAEVIAILGVCWPLVVFGFGCGWGFESHQDKEKLGCQKHIHDLKDKAGVDPLTTSEWDSFMLYIIENSSKEQLERLVTTIHNGIDLPNEKTNRIILSELANRDLLEV